MAKRFQQFLGARPGTVVELVDDKTSPYRVRTEGGFEYTVAADDFRNYYKEEGTETPKKWRHMITDTQGQMVESDKMVRVMETIRPLETRLRDFDRARELVRDVLSQMSRAQDESEIRRALADNGWDPSLVSDEYFSMLRELPQDVRDLLLGDTCAVIPFLDAGDGPQAPSRSGAAGSKEDGKKKGAAAKGKTKKKAKPKSRVAGMNNVELSVDGDILSVVVDLSQDFGPSKSGKTRIVASTRGNKTVPGREERIGLNVYRQDTKKAAKGRRKSFKNVEMDVQGDILTIKIDLSKDFGPSKSGQTTIIASSEGNQLVYGREEKIGLNVYKKID